MRDGQYRRFEVSTDRFVCPSPYTPAGERMVQDRIRDGKRIAQFLASELSGLDRPALEDVEIRGADPAVEPIPGGSEAYRITVSDDTVATVTMYDESVELRLEEPREWHLPDTVEDLSVAGTVLTVEDAASVKQVVDALCETLGGV